MTDLLAILVANGGTWGISLTLIIALLIVAVVGLYRDNKRQDAENDARFKKIEDDKKEDARMLDSKLDQIFNKVNMMAEDVAVLKDRDERSK